MLLWSLDFEVWNLPPPTTPDHRMQTILIALHGILTGQTSPSWPDQLDAWMFEHAPDIKVLKKESAAGPSPRINCFLKDPWLARSLSNEVEFFLEGRAGSPLPAAVADHQ